MPQIIQAGDSVTLTLFWQLLTPVATQGPIETFIQVAPLDPEAQAAATSQLLGTSRYPATFWQPGEIVVQPYRLEIAHDTPAPSLYWFDVILFDENKQARLPVTWQDQPLNDDFFRIGPHPIFTSERPGFAEVADSTPAVKADFNFDGQIRLNGYSFAPAAGPPGLEVTLFWEALSQPAVDWTVFVHLLNKNGELITQGDGLPRGGNFPTTWWMPGTVVPDTHLLPGELGCLSLSQYTVMVGFYNPATDERLPVSLGSGQPLPNAAVEIKPDCS